MYMARMTQEINSALKVIGMAGFSGVSARATSTAAGLNSLLGNKGPQNHRILAELRRQDLVHISKNGDKITFGLTPAGAYRLQQVAIDEIEIPKLAKWDGTWRAVMFDVPVSQSRSRVILAAKLKSLGFVMLQKSVWVHPYPCFKQIEKLAGHYNVLRHCSLVEISSFDELSTRRLIKHFPDLS